MSPLLLLWAALTSAADRPSGDLFGALQSLEGSTLPRAALVHLVPAPPIPFLSVRDGNGQVTGFELVRDDTGVLGSLGLRRGDRLDARSGKSLTSSEDLACVIADLFSAARMDLLVERDGARRSWSLTLVGPPAPVPNGPRVTVDGRPVPVPTSAPIALAPEGDPARVTLPRSALIPLVDAGVHLRPVRDATGTLDGYVVSSPLLAAIGWDTTAFMVNGHRLDSDTAARAAVFALFTGDRLDIAEEGRQLDLRLEGPPVPPPAFWSPSIDLDPAERRTRAGVRIGPEGVWAPRAVFAPLASSVDPVHLTEQLRVGALSADEVLGAGIAELLDLPPGGAILAVDDTPLRTADDAIRLWRALLAGEGGVLRLEGRVVRIAVEGPPLAIPEGWPTDPSVLRRLRTAALKAELATEPRLAVDGDEVSAQRAEIRRLLAEPLTGRLVTKGIELAPHALWAALGVPTHAVLVAIDGEPVQGEDALAKITDRLCSSPEVSLEFQDLHRRIVVVGGPVSPP